MYVQDLLVVMLIAAFFTVLVVADLAQPSDSPSSLFRAPHLLHVEEFSNPLFVKTPAYSGPKSTVTLVGG